MTDVTNSRPLRDWLEKCTVRLKRGHYTGTGFFVAPGLIATCAHVLQLSRAEGQPVEVFGQGFELEGKLSHILPEPCPLGDSVPVFPDVALIAVEQTSAPCVLLGTDFEIHDKFYVWGYPPERPGGDSLTPECEGSSRYEPDSPQHHLIKMTQAQVLAGFSGAPVLNLRTGMVCGMVKRTRDPKQNLGGMAVRTELMVQLFPNLADAQRKYHSENLEWTQRQAKLSAIEIITPDHQREVHDRQGLLILLKQVKALWIEGVLDKSVHSETLIELGKQTDPEAIEDPLETVRDSPVRRRERVPLGKRVVDIFDEMHDALLILGEPGSGKTVTLLELARDLIIRAEGDPTKPIPVVLNLSSWASKDKELDEWMVNELNAKYYVPNKDGHRWIKKGKLVLLLDGLDEVEKAVRRACAEAINHFHLRHRSGIAVCSRMDEFRALAIRLKVQAAISLQPLTAQQIYAFVAAAGPKTSGLLAALQQDATLQELAQSPLTLSIMTLAYSNISAEELRGNRSESTDARQNQVFETYVAKMLRRQKVHQKYTPETTVKGLAWLARKMAQHNQSVFLIENLQPSWLANPLQRWFYVVSSRLFAALIIAFAFVSLLAGIFLGSPGIHYSDVSSLLLIPLVGCVGAGLAIAQHDGLRLMGGERDARGDIASKSKIRNTISTGLRAMLGFGLTYVVLYWFGQPLAYWFLLLARHISSGVWGFVVVAIVIALPFGLIMGLRRQWLSSKIDIRRVESLTWSWRKFFAPLVILGLMGGAVTLLITTMAWKPGTKLLDVDGNVVSYLKGKRARFSRDGTRISTANDDGIQLWNGQDGTRIAAIYASPDSDVAEFSPDGAVISIPGGMNGLELWNSEKGTLIGTVKPKAADQGSLLFSPDSRRILTASVERSALGEWDPRTGDPIDDTGTGGLWDTSTGKLMNTIPIMDTWYSVVAGFNRDSTRFETVGEDNKCRLWNAVNGKFIANLGAVDRPPRFTPDGKRILTAYGEHLLRLWNSEDGILVNNLEDEVKYFDVLRFASDEARIVTVSEDGTERLWDGRLGTLVTTLNGQPVIDRLHIHPRLNQQGTRILQMTEDGAVALWDAKNGKLITRGDTGQVSLLRFSPDGTRFTTVSKDGTIKLWDTESGKSVATLNAGGELASIEISGDTIDSYPVFSPDGGRAVAVRQDGMVALWSNETGASIATLEAHMPYLAKEEDFKAFEAEKNLAFSPDGDRIVAVSPDGTARFWDGKTGKLLAAISNVQVGNGVSFSADSERALITFAGVESGDHRALSVMMLPIGLLVGLFMGLRPNIKDAKSYPNEGIWLSAKNALMVGLAWGIVLALLGTTVLIFSFADMSVSLTHYLPPAVPAVLGLFAFFTALSALWYGGLDFIQHFILRAILYFAAPIPCNCSRFLDQAADCILLRKVGGGYIFIHRLLLEYFASGQFKTVRR